MKYEIEITEEEIRSAIERKIRVAIADQSNQWDTDRNIKDMIKKRWTVIAEDMIDDMLSNSKVLREKIQAELERKIRSQLNAAIKKAGV